MADANLQVRACPECGNEGSGLRTQPVVGSEANGPDQIVIVMWCQYCGWYRTNDTPRKALLSGEV